MRSDDAGTMSIDWYTQDDTAIAGKDYAAREGTVQFRPGEVAKEVSYQYTSTSRQSRIFVKANCN